MSTPARPLFLAHGAPTLAVEKTAAHEYLKNLAQELPRPRYIVMLSAHWETRDLEISAPGKFETIHDFGGFSSDLFKITYPATALPQDVEEVEKCLIEAGLLPKRNSARPLDHGAWVPLSLVYPDAAVPLVMVSLPDDSTPRLVHAIGKALSGLAATGVLIVGSGSTTHNLRRVFPQGSPAPDWATGFDTWLDEKLHDGNIAAFDELRERPDYRQNHPTDEHLLPLFFALGAAGDEPNVELLHRSYEYGSISMSYFRF